MFVHRLLVAAAVTTLALAVTAPRLTRSDPVPHASPDTSARTGPHAVSGTDRAGGGSPTTGEGGSPTTREGGSPNTTGVSPAAGSDRTTPGAGAPTPPAEAKPTGSRSLAALPDLTRRPQRPRSLLAGRLPAEAQTRGSLVAGYPRRIVPAAPRSTVATSSVSPAGRRLQVALVAGTARSADAVLRFYRATFTPLGLVEIPIQTVAGSDAAAFRRGASSVVVTVTPGATTSYTVFAVLSRRGA